MSEVARNALQPREIRALHWCTPAQAREHVAPYVARMLDAIDAERDAAGQEERRVRTIYLQDGLPA